MHTHPFTHVYIYNYVCVCVCVAISLHMMLLFIHYIISYNNITQVILFNLLLYSLNDKNNIECCSSYEIENIPLWFRTTVYHVAINTYIMKRKPQNYKNILNPLSEMVVSRVHHPDNQASTRNEQAFRSK